MEIALFYNIYLLFLLANLNSVQIKMGAYKYETVKNMCCRLWQYVSKRFFTYMFYKMQASGKVLVDNKGENIWPKFS